MELTEKAQIVEPVICHEESGMLTVTLNRPEAGNSLSADVIAMLHEICDRVEQEPSIQIVLLRAEPPSFSTGMDFAIADNIGGSDQKMIDRRGFASLLHRLSSLPVTVVAHVEGDAIAGGAGLAAACDVIIAHPSVHFRLTEVIWGLQPANIAPYLIRRLGFQRAYRMALTSALVNAKQAEDYGLADFVAADAAPILRDLRTNARRVTRKTVRCTKSMFEDFWLFDNAMRERADAQMHRALADPDVGLALRRYRETGRFPWEFDH